MRVSAVTPPLIPIPSSNRPFLIRCENHQKYLCKTAKTPFPLISEALTALLLAKTDLATPPFVFIDLPDHIIQLTLLKSEEPYFSLEDVRPFFGSLFQPGAEVLLDSFDLISDKNTPVSSEYLFLFKKILRLAMVDLWLGNVDRDESNQNILIYTRDHSRERPLYDFYPIDHEKCTAFRVITEKKQLPENWMAFAPQETLAELPFIKTWLVHIRERKKRLFDEILEELHLFFDKQTQINKPDLENYLSLLPNEWITDDRRRDVLTTILQYLTDSERLKTLEHAFFSHLKETQ